MVVEEEGCNCNKQLFLLFESRKGKSTVRATDCK
jgi:hypothetical protein